MKNLFSVLRKPNALDQLSEGDPRDKPWLWNTVRGQITILHTLGRVYIICSCLAIAYSNVCLGLPVTYRDSSTSPIFAQALMIYVCFHMVTNFILVFYFASKSHFNQCGSNKLPISSRMNGPRSNLPTNVVDYRGASTSDGHWYKCKHCEIDVPPRARHCSICRACVLKKDHHCFFTGCCIGFYNQRFFTTFCLFGFVFGTWASFNLVAYLSTVYASLFSLQVYKFFMPYVIISGVIGYNTLSNFFLVLLLYLHISCTATTAYYFCWQMFIILRGQTSYEFLKGKKLYDDSVLYNIRSVFGRYWFIGLVFPVPYLINEGDGISWQHNSKTS